MWQPNKRSHKGGMSCGFTSLSLPERAPLGRENDTFAIFEEDIEEIFMKVIKSYKCRGV